MATSRYELELGGGLDRAITRMAQENGITPAEAVLRALAGYANLREIVWGRELVLRRRGDPGSERRVVVE